jgi:general secretion pathway protein D
MRSKLVFALLALFPACPALASPIVSIAPSTTMTAPGSMFSVDINVTDAFDLYAFEFDLGFNQGALLANSTLEGSLLSNLGPTFFIPGTIDNGAGTISFTSNSLLSAIPGATGNGTLATVIFTAVAPSITTLNVFNLVLLDSQLSGIPSSSVGGSVSVTGAAVPEPSTIALVGLGLACVRRRLRSKGVRRSRAHELSAES